MGGKHGFAKPVNVTPQAFNEFALQFPWALARVRQASETSAQFLDSATPSL
jgi:hypothetical protein